MKVEWLDAELNEARLIRGRWWWRRCAVVERSPDPDVPIWRFTNSGFECSATLRLHLESMRTLARENGHEDIDWHRHRMMRPKRKALAQARLRVLP